MSQQVVTAWFRWLPKAQAWEYNHFEFGEVSTSTPTDAFNRCWHEGTWKSVRAHLEPTDNPHVPQLVFDELRPD